MARASAPVRSARSSRGELDDLTLRRAQQGERAALDTLVERYQPMIHALVWRMACAQGPARVADLVQDAFVRVLQGLARFDAAGPARLSTWILTIATRVVLNDRRRVEPRAVLDELPLAPALLRDVRPATATRQRDARELRSAMQIYREHHANVVHAGDHVVWLF